MRSLSAAAALIILASCSPADERRAGATETGSNGAGRLSSSDTMPAPAAPASATTDSAATPAAILSQMNVANTAEIQVARMAAKKASSSDVKKLAEKLAVDHSKNREEVKALARKLNQPVTPAAGGDITAPDSAAMPSDLEGKSGADFDRAFVEHQIRVHQSNIQKLQDQMLPAADNAQVKVYLQKTLADMQRHLASLQEVQQKISS